MSESQKRTDEAKVVDSEASLFQDSVASAPESEEVGLAEDVAEVSVDDLDDELVLDVESDKYEATSSLEEDTSEAKVLSGSPKRTSWIRKFGDSVKRLFGIKPKTAGKSLTADSAALDDVPSASQLERDLVSVTKQLEKQYLELQRVSTQISVGQEDLKAQAERLAFFQTEYDRLMLWLGKVSRTYVWKVHEKVLAQISAAKNDLQRYEKAVNNIETLNEGRLDTLRKQFHSGLAKTSSRILILVLATILIANLTKIPKFTWLALLYNPATSGPILAFALVLLFFANRAYQQYRRRNMQVAAEAEAAKKKAAQDEAESSGDQEALTDRKSAEKPKKSFKPAILLILSALLLFVISLVPNFFIKRVMPLVLAHFWEIMAILAGVGLATLIALLLNYYAGWSMFRRQVSKQITQLTNVINGYTKAQQEVGRLTLLNRQVTEWLEVLAQAVYKPWTTDPNWGSTKEFDRHFETFPRSLRVAVAIESDATKMAALENQIAQGLLVQGWRNDAFEDLVMAVGQEMGMAPDKMTVKSLDEDLPHQSNNTRNLMRKHLGLSAQSAEEISASLARSDDEASTEKTQPESHLIRVAKERLVQLVNLTQDSILSEVTPSVQQITDDPLESLRTDIAGIDNDVEQTEWTEFLLESMGTGVLEQLPLSPLNFTDAGRSASAAVAPKVFVIAPKRIRDVLPDVVPSDADVQVSFMSTTQPRPVEISLRVELAGPMEPTHLRVLSQSQTVEEPADISAPAKSRRGL